MNPGTPGSAAPPKSMWEELNMEFSHPRVDSGSFPGRFCSFEKIPGIFNGFPPWISKQISTFQRVSCRESPADPVFPQGNPTLENWEWEFSGDVRNTQQFQLLQTRNCNAKVPGIPESPGLSQLMDEESSLSLRIPHNGTSGGIWVL